MPFRECLVGEGTGRTFRRMAERRKAIMGSEGICGALLHTRAAREIP
jgi:hypothetical protein